MKDPEDNVTYELQLERTCQEITKGNTKLSLREENMSRGWKGREQEGNLTPKVSPEQEKTLPM